MNPDQDSERGRRETVWRKSVFAAIAVTLVALPCSSLEPEEILELRAITRIQDDADRLNAFDSWAKSVLPPATVPGDELDWVYVETKDELTGTVDGRLIVSVSKNDIHGRLDSGRLLLGVSCGGAVYMMAPDLGGFGYQTYLTMLQTTRVRFDDPPVHVYYWTVSAENNEIASLNWGHSPFVVSLSAGTRMTIEVELADAEKQEAHFGLSGFTEVYGRCPK